MDYLERVISLLEPGKTLRIFYNKGNVNNKLIHIRAVVDGYTIVFRWWSRKRRNWVYEVEDYYYFYIRFNDGVLREEK